MKVVTSEQMREIDYIAIERRGIPALDLMERAGTAVADAMAELVPSPAEILVLFGRGNNGGDGLVAARQLANAGYSVTAAAVSGTDRLVPEALSMFEKLPPSVKVVPEYDETSMEALIDSADGVVDAMLGTGASDFLRPPFDRVVRALNAAHLPVVSVDLPTGMNGDTGDISTEAVLAATTVTFGLPKMGLLTGNGVQCAGVVRVEHVGFPEDLLTNPEIQTETLTIAEAAELLPPRTVDANKGTFGLVAVCAGSQVTPGAAILAGLGALRSGVGLVRLHVPGNVRALAAQTLFEAILSAVETVHPHTLSPLSEDDFLGVTERAKAIVIGPGMGRSSMAEDFLAQILERYSGPVLLDADALNILADDSDLLGLLRPNLVLTPHPGEMGRLMGLTVDEVQRNRMNTVRDAAQRFGCTVVLKGFGTLVSTPKGMVTQIPTGNTALAKGGSGDVLSGVIGGLLAQGRIGADAAKLGAFVCGLAADILVRDRSVRGVITREIADALPLAFRELESIKPHRH